MVAADGFQSFDLRGIQSGQRFKPPAGGIDFGSHIKFPARSAKFNACVITDAEVDFSDIGDILEVIERSGEVVFYYVVK